MCVRSAITDSASMWEGSHQSGLCGSRTNIVLRPSILPERMAANWVTGVALTAASPGAASHELRIYARNASHSA